MFIKTFKLILLSFSLLISVAFSDEIRVAVASNFVKPLKKLSGIFEKNTNHKIIISAGATGRHYTQIINKAPFDIFFAADSKRPKLLEDNGFTIKGTRFTYAFGQLVLLSNNPQNIKNSTKLEIYNLLSNNNLRHIAIANPKLAPYGKAAKEVISKLKLWNNLQGKIVKGANISQTFSFVKTKNTELGFVAYSQVKNSENLTNYWIIPKSYYQPIKQQAVIIKSSKALNQFVNFIKSPTAKKIIKHNGYEVSQ